jgi:hypothetical protein
MKDLKRRRKIAFCNLIRELRRGEDGNVHEFWFCRYFDPRVFNKKGEHPRRKSPLLGRTDEVSRKEACSRLSRTE